MPNIFADTSGWGNLVDVSQPSHSLTATLYRLARQQNQKLITTNYVIAELVALLTSPLRLPRKTTVSFIHSLKTSPHVEILHISPELDEAAWQLLSTRMDKEWSLVDCSSFAIMQHLNLTEALTTDHHFEQAGFIRLLK
ncbi:PIN domain-containing protein [Phormidesmis priestleyi ULC007]|uniref:PIN domain-containing protein n=1 Tax=Phormidesmis priestleyi ULC007 TaxID=1920490 RepID=A0A2T1DE14_9CYAN|nr:PIN domain-containing protein [Phormidesmis priestleyi]PSB18681.1 PIN domain-containing protein [Phormidesmis priestleyi ULC007]PZO51558.1 MAG: PIN domain-containing protein [Phormidesmis priestleyi]